jgi:hypothetical protein
MNHKKTLLDRPAKRASVPPAPGSPFTRSDASPFEHQPTPSNMAKFEAAMVEYKRRSGRRFSTSCEVQVVLAGSGHAKPDDQPTPPPEGRAVRHRVQIRADGPRVRSIADTLTQNGGIRVDSRLHRIYEFPSRSAYDATLIAARSVHG